jgi:hypothetical protein
MSFAWIPFRANRDGLGREDLDLMSIGGRKIGSPGKTDTSVVFRAANVVWHRANGATFATTVTSSPSCDQQPRADVQLLPWASVKSVLLTRRTAEMSSNRQTRLSQG